jgi:hypothetical protein
MKALKYLWVACLALCASAQAQVVTILPSSFTAEDEVTVRVDLTGTPVAGAAQPYLWTWCQTNAGGGNDGVTNGSWTSSNDAAKFTRVGATGNVWEIKFVGTTMYNRTPGELRRFGFLVKCKDGSCQTPDQQWFNFDPLTFTEGEFRTFPSKAAANDVVTVYHKKSLAGDVNVQRMTETSVSVTLFDQNNAPIQTINNLAVKTEANGLVSATFVPENLVTLPNGVSVKRIEYKFKGTYLNTSGMPTAVESNPASQDLFLLQ